MGVAADDWRRMGQEDFLREMPFTWRSFQAYSGNWDHEHCEFCSTKFVDPHYADWMREKVAAGSPDHLAGGFANLRHRETPSARYWICRQCFGDFRLEFGWPVVESDPDAWPYDNPEPSPRPTAADYDADGLSKGP